MSTIYIYKYPECYTLSYYIATLVVLVLILEKSAVYAVSVNNYDVTADFDLDLLPRKFSCVGR